MVKKFYRSRLPACGRISSSSTAGPLQPMTKRYRGNDTSTNNAGSFIPYPRSSTERPRPHPAPPSAGGGSADSDDLIKVVLAKFYQGKGILFVKLPNGEFTVPVTHKLHLASPSVGYGLLEPKARDALEVKLVEKARPRPQDQLETVGKDNYSIGEDDLECRYAVERVRLLQLSPRSKNEWLNFFKTMYRHLEGSNSNASVDDLGNLKIIWGQLLNVDFAGDDFRVSLSDAVGRFLLTLQHRCSLPLQQRDWDLAYDWILYKLMKPRCLNRFMRPLLEVIIENEDKGRMNSSPSKTKTADAGETAHEKIAIEGATASPGTVAETSVEANETADQKLLGQLTRLMCAKDETVLNRALLPMARELAPSETDKTLLSLLHCRRLLRHIGRRANGGESTEAKNEGGEETPSVSSLHVMPFSLSRRPLRRSPALPQ